MSLFTVDMSEIKNLRRYFDTAPEAAQNAARDAINGAIRFAYAESSREIRKQVNFPQDYIGSVAQGNRLKVSLFATKEVLQARIRADVRQVSLARFANDRTTFGKRPRGVDVTVKPGRPANMPGAFLIKLKVGSKPVTSDDFNIGLAVRLKPGEKPGSKHTMVQFDKLGDPGLYLLYGPSVDQVFNHVRDIVEPPVMEFLTSEFYRQFARHGT
jgi:hypothetical protein